MKRAARHWSMGLILGLLAGTTWADWDPGNGQWGKSDPDDVRIMTYNVHDGISSAAVKLEQDNNSWCALAHIVAAMKPDVLLLQEAGDTGNGVDSVADLYTTLDLFLYGGNDPFLGGTVTAWVQKYDPDYDLPYAFVSSESDGYNRNVILSRFPFADLNDDNRSLYSDIPSIIADEYAPGGDGGVRGCQMVEIDLDDAIYCGDLVVTNSHLKAYDDPGSMQQRLEAAQNIAYLVDYWYNGAGTGQPDPHGRIQDVPQAQTILGEFTPVVLGGDWNEDEDQDSRRGPAAWMTQAQYPGSNDGTDRDRSDMTYDEALHPITGLRSTYGTSKLDYLAWQDSIASLRRAFIFHSSGTPTDALPPEVLSYANPSSVSWDASDHRPVLIDLILPQAAAGDCGDPCAGYLLGDADGNGVLNAFDIDPFILALTDSQAYIAQYGETAYACRCDISGDGVVNAFDIDPFIALLTGG